MASRVTISVNALLCLLICAALANMASAQTNDAPRKSMRAVKAHGKAPRVDGRLDDPVWSEVTWTSDFLDRDPVEGAQPREKTEVAIAYDESNLYVAARMYSDHPDKLRVHLDKRDQAGPSEWFIVCLDTYLDRRSSYEFGVSVSGCQLDRYIADDNEFNTDNTFNAVWHSHAAVDSKGWTAEFAIPFSQLRFIDKEQQTFGVNFDRWIPERNEDVFWIIRPRNETGWASRFGNLEGIEGVKPSRRMELIPYVASNASVIDGNFSGNPFTDGKELGGRVGADFKMGLGPNLTLDATINPDFGQVEADPAQLNLSAFEIFYDERRPFFTEGAALLSGPSSAGYFYSRRIGAQPKGWADGDFVDSPNSASILGAAKVTGRLKSGTSIGILGAVTQREFAKSYHGVYEVTDGAGNVIDTINDYTASTEIEPATFYGVSRVQQQFGQSNSIVGAMITGVHRDLDANTRLDSLLRRDAIAGGADLRLKFNGGKYEWFSMAGFSHVRGSEAAIARTQRSPLRYLQRPDADYLASGAFQNAYDPTRTSLTGIRALTQFAKKGGAWTWSLQATTKSPELEINDLGSQASSDDINLYANAQYRNNNLKSGPFRTFYWEIWQNAEWNYGGVRQFGEIGTFTELQFRNYYNVWLSLNHQITGQDASKTRGGPSMKNEAGLSLNRGFNSDGRKTMQFGANWNYGMDYLNGWLIRVGGYVSGRVGPRLRLSIEPNFTSEEQPTQFVATLDGPAGGNATYGRRYVFARMDRTTASLDLRASYYFKPNLTLEVFMQPYATAGRYFDQGELATPASNNMRVYGLEPGTSKVQNPDGSYSIIDNGESFTVPYTDFGYRAFRSNMVLRWEFLPGSSMYLVWQRSLDENKDSGRMIRPGSLFDAFGADGQDFVALKIAYWLSVS